VYPEVLACSPPPVVISREVQYVWWAVLVKVYEWVDIAPAEGNMLQYQNLSCDEGVTL
jgi:hypothetical protein